MTRPLQAALQAARKTKERVIAFQARSKNPRFRSTGRPRANLQQETLRALATASFAQRAALQAQRLRAVAVPYKSTDVSGRYDPLSREIRISSPYLRRSREEVQGLLRHEIGHAIIQPEIPLERSLEATEVHHDILRRVGLAVTDSSALGASRGRLRDLTPEIIRRYRRDY